MKVITAIYLNCRPDLRDEWLMGVDVDSDLDDALPQEHALRALVKFFTTKHYSIYAPQQHRRSSSLGQPGGFHGEGHPASPASAFRQSFAGGHNTSSLPDTFEGDMFPPPRSAASWDDHFRATYIPDAIMEGYLDNYEEIIDGLFDPRPITGEENASLSAWNRLGQILGEGDDISDSESVASIGFLGTYDDDGSSTDGGWDSKEEQVHRWEAIRYIIWKETAVAHVFGHSPETMNALEEEKQSGAPRSPRPRRKSSGPTSPALRPVLSEDGEDYSNPVIMDREDEQIMEALPHEGPAVDEVEAVFHV
ncbi:hypothetical protein BT69DRAFT_243 [Atractiella rhizophila]|nr:hypothetical protein BT69DRAFT_243 [Atractiella rhizophila]